MGLLYLYVCINDQLRTNFVHLRCKRARIFFTTETLKGCAQIGECNLFILLEQYSLRFTTKNLLVRQVGSTTLYACVCPSDVTTISALDSYRRARSMGCSARQTGSPLIIFEK